jgi:hypothetical protein
MERRFSRLIRWSFREPRLRPMGVVLAVAETERDSAFLFMGGLRD